MAYFDDRQWKPPIIRLYNSKLYEIDNSSPFSHIGYGIQHSQFQRYKVHYLLYKQNSKREKELMKLNLDLCALSILYICKNTRLNTLSNGTVYKIDISWVEYFYRLMLTRNS